MRNSLCTKKGIDLAIAIDPHSKLISFISHGKILSLICRNATTHHRIQEELCAGPRQYWDSGCFEWSQEWQDRVEAKEKRLETRIQELAKKLPGVKGVKFSGDPRGCTVKLVLVNGRYDDWGQEGICVPQDHN